MRTAAETVRDHPGLQFSFYLETVRLYRCFFFHIYVKEINCRRSVKGEDMKKRRWICMFLLLQVLWCSMTGMAVYGMEPDIPVSAVVSGQAQAVSIQAPSAVLMEEDITPETLLAAVRDLYQKRMTYVNNMALSEQNDAIGKIMELITANSK